MLEDGEKAEVTAWLMDRATGTAVGDPSSIGYTDGDSGNGGSGSGLTTSHTLIVKSTRFVVELTSNRRCQGCSVSERPLATLSGEHLVAVVVFEN